VISDLRGNVGFFGAMLRPSIRGTLHTRWSRTLYSPLALLLAALVGCAMLA
jgi:fluoride ion exporter CrcB/FEX